MAANGVDTNVSSMDIGQDAYVVSEQSLSFEKGFFSARQVATVFLNNMLKCF